MNGFYNKHFLKLLDFTPAEISSLLELSASLKAMKKAGIPHRYCEGKSIALVFEKTSTRTRCAFEVAAADLGMHPVIWIPRVLRLAKKKVLLTPPVFWAACLTGSNTVVSVRKLWKNWLNTPVFRFGMV